MQELALEAKKKNTIDMALGFTAMTRVFQKGSADLIKEALTGTCTKLELINSEADFMALHDKFCQWLTQTIKLAKGGALESYGHGAKVLDITLTVDTVPHQL